MKQQPLKFNRVSLTCCCRAMEPLGSALAPVTDGVQYSQLYMTGVVVAALVFWLLPSSAQEGRKARKFLSCCPHALPYYHFHRGKSILGVIYRVLLWADMNAATPLGAWGRSVIPLPRCCRKAARDVDTACAHLRVCRVCTSRASARLPMMLHVLLHEDRNGSAGGE